MKNLRRMKVTVTLSLSLARAKNEPERVAFKVGSWTYYSETPKQARKLISSALRKMVVDP